MLFLIHALAMSHAPRYNGAVLRNSLDDELNRSRLWHYLLHSTPLLLAVLIYGYTINLSFFLDDGLLFDMIRDYPGGMEGFRFWGGSPSFPYYRPLVFSLWEFNGLALDGRYSPILWHLVNVVVFGITGVGISLITHRITQHLVMGIIAGWFYILFPFNYNAVMWVASLFHLLAVMGTVFAFYFALRFLENHRSRISFILTLLFTFIGVFSHENGVLVLPIFGVYVLLSYGSQTLRNYHIWTIGIPMAQIVGVFLYLFLTLPRPGSAALFRPEILIDNLALLLHGIAYPLSSLIRRITLAEASTELLLLMVTIVVIPALFFLWRMDKQHFKLAGFGLFWYVLASTPTVLFLETDYIIGSWRLLLAASPGAGLFWGVLLGTLLSLSFATGYDSKRRQRIPRYIAISIMAWSVLVSLLFLSQRRHEALIQTQYLRDLKAEIEEHATGAKPLIVNAPSFITASDKYRFFPTVGMGVIFVADFVNYSQLYEAEAGESFPYVDALAYHQILDAPDTMSFAPLQNIQGDFTEQVRQSSDLFATIFDNDEFYPMYVGYPETAGNDEPIAEFPSAGVSITEAEAELLSNRELVLHSRWRTDNPQAVEPSFQVYCYDNLVGEATWMVWGNIHPFRVWKVGESQTDRREIRLSRPVIEACLDIRVRIVDEEDNSVIHHAQHPETDEPFAESGFPIPLISQ